MELIELAKKLEDTVAKNDLTELASSFQNDFAISKSEELQKAIDEMDNENRILKLGIIGRVKAGKSSLLNALIFDGKDILPKAATPMTAALTILKYGEQLQADVEFFTQEDIDDLKQDAFTYEKRLKQKQEQEYQKLLERKKKRLQQSLLSESDKQEITEKAKSIARREMKKDAKLSSSYDQYQKIKTSGITLNYLKQYETISANTIEDLNQKLLEFVGADGEYMPFTKSVTLTLNEPSLKDLQIIDTPGVNDPVVSREDRTRELLKYCDVVLIVSPSGQFLSSEDQELMDRVTTKEGIRELYLVASQVDNQLFGSEKDNILNNTLQVIEDKLSKQQQEIFKSLKKQYPEIRDTFDSLINNRVILSSGICYSMMKTFNDKSSWDDNMLTVWNNLNKHYPDFFCNQELAEANLKKLANIDMIRSIIEKIRFKKDEILKRKKKSFTDNKRKSLIKYKEALQNEIKEQVHRIETSDIEKIKEQKNSLEEFRIRATDAANETYLDLVEDLEINFKAKIIEELNSYFKKSTASIEESEKEESETWTTKEGGFFGFFEDNVHHSNTFTTVKATYVCEILKGLTSSLEDIIDIKTKKYIAEWRKNLHKKLISILRQEAGEDNLDPILLSKILRNILNSAVFPDISYNNSLPKSLKKSGILTKSDAEEFIGAALDYVSDLRQKVRTDIKTHINRLIKVLKSKNIGEEIFAKYKREIEELEDDIKNKEMSLSRRNYILKQLEAIDG